MLVVNVSKNVEDYQENVLGNLDAKKTADILAGTVISALVCVLFHAGFGAGLTVSFYISSPFLFVFVLKALYFKDGMDFATAFRQRHYGTYKGPCIYQSRKNNSLYFADLEREWILRRKAEEEAEGADWDSECRQAEKTQPAAAAERKKTLCLAAGILFSLAATAAAVLYLMEP